MMEELEPTVQLDQAANDDLVAAVSAVPPDAARGGSEASTFVYALGRIEPRFPSLAIEKECAQAMGRGENSGLTDRQALQSLLSERSNRYLARQLCWIYTIEGLETYILWPRDPA